jgi:hypothetical protein
LSCKDQLRDHEHNNYVNSFLCPSTNDLENILLPNDLIVIRNQGVDHGEHVGHQEGAGEPGKHAQHGVEVQANLESRSLASSPSRRLGPPCLQIGVQDASDLRFG